MAGSSFTLNKEIIFYIFMTIKQIVISIVKKKKNRKENIRSHFIAY